MLHHTSIPVLLQNLINRLYEEPSGNQEEKAHQKIKVNDGADEALHERFKVCITTAPVPHISDCKAVFLEVTELGSEDVLRMIQKQIHMDAHGRARKRANARGTCAHAYVRACGRETSEKPLPSLNIHKKKRPDRAMKNQPHALPTRCTI